MIEQYHSKLRPIGANLRSNIGLISEFGNLLRKGTVASGIWPKCDGTKKQEPRKKITQSLSLNFKTVRNCQFSHNLQKNSHDIFSIMLFTIIYLDLFFLYTVFSEVC